MEKRQKANEEDTYHRSPYDTDVRYRRRCGTTWTGYITHLSETCDDDSCHLIMHVMTTDASVHKHSALTTFTKR